jgi:hypothetical protein
MQACTHTWHVTDLISAESIHVPDARLVVLAEIKGMVNVCVWVQVCGCVCGCACVRVCVFVCG